MVQIATFVSLAAALIAGVQAFEPMPPSTRGFLHCGDEIVNKYQSYAATELATFTPKEWNVFNTLYRVNSVGELDQPQTTCPNGCIDNADNVDATCA